VELTQCRTTVPRNFLPPCADKGRPWAGNSGSDPLDCSRDLRVVPSFPALIFHHRDAFGRTYGSRGRCESTSDMIPRRDALTAFILGLMNGGQVVGRDILEVVIAAHC
jgi:hypothetical protein